MKSRLFFIVAGLSALLVTAAPANCEDLPDQPESLPLRVMSVVDQHDTDIRSLDRRFLDSLEGLTKGYSKERETLQNQVLVLLNQELQEATQKGDLDQALLVRDHIREIEASEIVPPTSEGTGSSGHLAHRAVPTNDVLGRWRWANGVDITNFPAGRMSGNGTWRLVDSRTKTYEFRWKDIAPDRVQLSADGRLLEGTKSHDPSVRVWAVRIE